MQEQPRRTALPYPHARNDCQVCRESANADFEVSVDDPVVSRDVAALPAVPRPVVGHPGLPP